jgi:surface protein
MPGGFKNPIPFLNRNTEIQPWIRPSEWISIPSTINEEKFVGVVAIWPDGFNGTAVLCEGNYTVDWGDGDITDYNSGIVASHDWDYDSISGTINSLGYKTVVVTITPQSGNNFTKLDLTVNNTTINSNGLRHWLDIEFNLPNATFISLTIRSFGSNPTRLDNVQRIVSHSIGNITSFDTMFSGCISLQYLLLPDTSKITTTFAMFHSCALLQSVPLFNTTNVTNMSRMFEECRQLLSVPLFNTSNVTDMFAMFSGNE